MFEEYIGKSQERTDMLQPQQAQFMAASLGQARSFGQGDALPPGWHWLYFLQAAPRDQLGRDGHSKRGDFLPPVTLPRRMWAGGRLWFHDDVLLGQQHLKRSTITKLEEKAGRHGPMALVTVTHDISKDDVLKLREEHDIVYLEDRKPGDPIADGPEPHDMEFSETFQSDSTLLFRYSALTFNGHRIHYDLDYCRQVEGYPGLLFHGPLTATLLLDLALRKIGMDQLKSFSFRAMAPIFHDEAITIGGRAEGDQLTLQAINSRGGVSMKAVVNQEA